MSEVTIPAEEIAKTQELEPEELRRLFILIHPLFSQVDRPEKRAMDSRAREMSLGKAEALWITPLLFGQSLAAARHELSNIKKARETNPNLPAWTDLYRYLKEKFPRRVLLMPEFAMSTQGKNGRNRVDEMLERTGQAGFSVTPDTEVVVGGEYLDLCVKNGALELFHSKSINRVALDIPTSTFWEPDKDRAIASILSSVNNNKAQGLNARYDSENQQVILERNVSK